MKLISLQNAILIGTGLLLAIFLTDPIKSHDIWWHLNNGLWMVDHGQILLKEQWSFTQNGAYWTNFSWLFQVTSALTYSLTGEWGLLTLKFLLTAAALFLLIFATAKKHGLGAFFLAFILLYPSIHEHLYLRPHIIEFIGIAYIIWLSQRPLNNRLAWITLAILLIWSNSHSSVVVAAAALALQVTFGKWEGEIDKKRQLIFAGLFGLTPLITPLGTDVIHLLLDHEKSIATSHYIVEWLPRDSYPPFLWMPILLIAAMLLLHKIRISPAEGFLLLFFLYFSLRSRRFEIELATILIRPLAATIDYFINRNLHKKAVQPALIISLLATMHLYVYREQTAKLAIFKQPNFPVTYSKFPSITSDLISDASKQLGRKLRVINAYNFGGYLAFRTKGAAQILVDGRTPTVFPEKFLMLPYDNKPVVLNRLAETYSADAALLLIHHADNKLDKSRWTLVAYDHISALFMRTELARKLQLPEIEYDPTAYSNTRNEQLDRNIRATEALLKIDEENYIALNHLALFKSATAATPQQWNHVYELLRRSQKSNPKDPFAQATLAFLLALQANNDLASLKTFVRELPAAKELNKGVSISYDLRYAETLLKADLIELANDYLYPKQPARLKALDELAETWRLRATLQHKQGKPDKAKESLEMASLISNSK